MEYPHEKIPFFQLIRQVFMTLWLSKSNVYKNKLKFGLNKYKTKLVHKKYSIWRVMLDSPYAMENSGIILKIEINVKI